MNKKWLVCAGAALLVPVLTIGTVFAANNIEFIKNGSKEKNAIKLQATQVGLAGSINQTAEVVNDSVGLDKEYKAEDNVDSKELQIQQLENALIPTDKRSAAELWAQSANTRNGALRYAILSPELKQKYYSAYKELNWVIGCSSPWIESYKIVENAAVDADTYRYEINYVLTDSTAEKYAAVENITVRRFDDNWLVIDGSEPSYDVPVK